MTPLPDGVWTTLLGLMLGGGAAQTWRAIKGGGHDDSRTDAERDALVTSTAKEVVLLVRSQLSEMIGQLERKVDELDECKLLLMQHSRRIQDLEDRLKANGIRP